MIELLSPAGNLEKLKTVFAYGADAAYLGLDKFSLRKNADNFSADDFDEMKHLKVQSDKKLYCALNILFSQSEIEELKAMLPLLVASPFDAFIISDMGLVDFLKANLPDRELHLSTQASCLNSESARFYYRQGFSRVILGREASIDDIKRIKDAVPELELEAFVHGAMCMSYSGRCLLSSFLAGRSANKGDCAHTCRWRYHLLLEEEERPGKYYPIEEADEGYTTILSSKDLCMIDHLEALKDAGLSSLKIEGRMKSVYYAAVVTRAYRKALDGDRERELYREDLFNVSHREFSTGFFFGRDADAISEHSAYGYHREYLFLGTIGERIEEGLFKLDIRNQIAHNRVLDYIGPDVLSVKDDDFILLDENFEEVEKLDHGKTGYIKTNKAIAEGWIIRAEADVKELS